MKKLGKLTWEYTEPVYIQATGTVVGPAEHKGPLGQSFDQSYDNLYCGEASFAKAERVLLKDAVMICLKKAGLQLKKVDYLLAGDLDHQLTASSFSARDLDLPFIGMYSACATASQTLIMAALLVETGLATHVLAGASSHHGVAEKQFRFPTEMAHQKSQTAQYTVTGAGVALVSRKKSSIKIGVATIGELVDMGIKDTTNMGAAMAPAAGQTLLTHLRETGRTLEDYDLILTGDLGRIGSSIFRKWMREHGYKLEEWHQDGGVKIFRSDPLYLAGGSGAGCAAVVTYGRIIRDLQKGTYNRVLLLATGALFSHTSVSEGDTIPAVAHAVSLERCEHEE
ncbi:stage V sporulation protein AD [Alkalicoccobacillus porphyridii]|uniref:Stage V sporulation protein AD n=1 Tax=Alkalicoccobacillus porphyridii TaxID=2597270 RepID=A0A553ZYM4_9BACI|nr:stage V sporulation protein AD [Alkalicoccobacillus porphyridii]TSB46542.1 stage V sporulation protein AD [Alkalicoccobacillus porphyridii]